MKFTSLGILLILLFLSCSRKKNNSYQTDDVNIGSFEVDDPRVERAKEIAQDSLKYFIDYFERYHGREHYSFYLKKAFVVNDEFEHMWSIPFSFYDDGFNCTLDNDPKTIKGYKDGDTVKVRFEDIEDFIVVTADSTIIGHYLKRALDKEVQQDEDIQ